MDDSFGMGRRGRRLATAAVLAAVAGCRPAPPEACVEAPAAVEPPPVAEPAAVIELGEPWQWPAPFCMAYSPRTVGYACVSVHAVVKGPAIAELEGLAMTDMLGLLKRHHVDAELGVDLVSAHGSQSRLVLDTTPNPATRVEHLGIVQDDLAHHGYTVPITTHAVLEPGVFVAVGGMELRFSWRRDEHPPSFDYVGRLELRCTPDGPVHEHELDRYGIGGPLAAVSSAEGATLHALTVEHRFGGEGFVTLEWRSWLLDEALLCP